MAARPPRVKLADKRSREADRRPPLRPCRPGGLAVMRAPPTGRENPHVRASDPAHRRCLPRSWPHLGGGVRGVAPGAGRSQQQPPRPRTGAIGGVGLAGHRGRGYRSRRVRRAAGDDPLDAGRVFPPGHAMRYDRYGLGMGAITVGGVQLLGHTGFIGAFAFHARTRTRSWSAPTTTPTSIAGRWSPRSAGSWAPQPDSDTQLNAGWKLTALLAAPYGASQRTPSQPTRFKSENMAYCRDDRTCHKCRWPYSCRTSSAWNGVDRDYHSHAHPDP